MRASRHVAATPRRRSTRIFARLRHEGKYYIFARSLPPPSSTRLANPPLFQSSAAAKISPTESSLPVPLPPHPSPSSPSPCLPPRFSYLSRGKQHPSWTPPPRRRLNRDASDYLSAPLLVHLRRDLALRPAGMRLHADVLDQMEGEGEEGAAMASSVLSPPLMGAAAAAGAAATPMLVVGYALTKKKVKSFLQPKLLQLARKNGISFVSIDESIPLSEQGPFDVILHKITSKEWQQVLEDYHEEHPEVTVLDPPNAIEHLNNRQSMLEEVADLNLSNLYGEVCTPRQLVITKDPSSVPTAVAMAGLTWPLVAKPLVVDGTSKGHELYLAYDEASLSMLHPPLVLQEFINHGGILFKVYIIGETVKVVRRFSLPDVNAYDLLNNVGVYRLPRVSCAAASADDAELDPLIAELPPRPLLEKLGRELRSRLGLRLFNIDMIRELGTKDRYYIIDINYFPGFGKMPGYEILFTDFLLSLAQSKYKRFLSGT